MPPLVDTGATIVASIWGRSVDEYRRAADLLAEAPAQVVAVEVNLSCPNVEDRAGCSPTRPRRPRRRWRPPRLRAPAVGEAQPERGRPGAHRRRRRAGSGGGHLVNTVMGMAIDPATRTYRLGNGGGGLSGAAIHPAWPCAPSTTSPPPGPRWRSSASAASTLEGAAERGEGAAAGRHRDLRRPPSPWPGGRWPG
ncbi:MAG: hypothetical protein R2711_04375 [Acidimicrobiales bacterium]